MKTVIKVQQRTNQDGLEKITKMVKAQYKTGRQSEGGFRMAAYKVARDLGVDTEGVGHDIIFDLTRSTLFLKKGAVL